MRMIVRTLKSLHHYLVKTIHFIFDDDLAVMTREGMEEINKHKFKNKNQVMGDITDVPQ